MGGNSSLNWLSSRYAFASGCALALALSLITDAFPSHLTTSSACQVLLERQQGNESELVMRVGTDRAGTYRYRLVNDERAYVTGMFMNPMYKGKHLSKVFVYAMLMRHPKIKTVGALLVIDNLRASGLLFAPKNVTQEQCIYGASQTPFARAFAHYGFKVMACKWNPLTTYLQVEVGR